MACFRNVKQWSEIMKEAVNGTFQVAKFLCFLHVTNTHLFTPVLTYGPSMLPTLNFSGDLVLADRRSVRSGEVRTGDIVVARSPVNPRKIVTKRVLGMEGDSVTYAVDPVNADRCETIIVPKGHVWIQGDSMYNSNDSRHFGPVPYGLLTGKVFWRIWPLKAFGSLDQRKDK